MSETISTDYINMINKKGSGYNIPEIVDAIVDAAIVPLKENATLQKEIVDASISGMGTLKSSALATQTLVGLMDGSNDYTLSSSEPNSLTITLSDASEIEDFSHTITDVITAKPMIMSVGGFTSATSDYGSHTLEVSVDGGAVTSITTDGTVNASELAEQVNAVTGLSAEMIKVDDDDYVMLIQSDDAGSSFEIDVTSASSNRMNTSAINSSTNILQSANDATFKLNGLAITRSSNEVTDVLDGVSINLIADSSSDIQISSIRSSSNIQTTVETLIGDLNAYKSDLDVLGFIDEVGDEDGDLANSSYLRMAKRQLTNLMADPITGFGDDSIYFVEFGIKTAADGTYVFDQTTFDRTFTYEPEKFDALTTDYLNASDGTSTVVSISSSGLPAGKYSYQNSDQTIISGSTSVSFSTDVSGSDTNYNITSSAYPGFVLNTASSNPSDFDFYIGHSVKTILQNFFTDALSSSGSYDTTIDLYEAKSSTLEEKLEQIDQRELLLQAMYTKQFADMEKIVTGTSSSSDYITQLVDGWKK